MWFIPFIPLPCAECDNSLPFSGTSIPLCYVLFPATLLHQLFFHPLSTHLAIYFLVCLSILLFPNSYIIPFWEFCFLPFSVHAQTNIIYLTFYMFLLTVHRGTALDKWPSWCTITLYNTFIVIILYMFRTTLCSSSGGILCKWLSSVHTRQSLTENTIPDIVLIQFELLMLRPVLLETCRGF